MTWPYDIANQIHHNSYWNQSGKMEKFPWRHLTNYSSPVQLQNSFTDLEWSGTPGGYTEAQKIDILPICSHTPRSMGPNSSFIPISHPQSETYRIWKWMSLNKRSRDSLAQIPVNISIWTKRGEGSTKIDDCILRRVSELERHSSHRLRLRTLTINRLYFSRTFNKHGYIAPPKIYCMTCFCWYSHHLLHISVYIVWV